MGGNFDKPSLWDLRNETIDPKIITMLPHVAGKMSADQLEDHTFIISVHWNTSGDKLVTSSSDSYARVWKVDEKEFQKSGEEDCKTLHQLKNFKIMLMMSKFNKGVGDMIASGGGSSVVTIWNPDTGKNVATFDHAEMDPGFELQEIEW